MQPVQYKLNTLLYYYYYHIIIIKQGIKITLLLPVKKQSIKIIIFELGYLRYMQEKSSVTADIIVRKAMYNMVTYANIDLNTNVQELHVSSGRSKPQNNLILSGVGGWKGEFLSRII